MPQKWADMSPEQKERRRERRRLAYHADIEKSRAFFREHQRKWRTKNPEKKRAKDKRCYNREKATARQRVWRAKNKDKLRGYRYRNYHAHIENSRAKTQRYRSKLRQQIFDHYVHSCACCGEAHDAFLSIDHIDGNGFKHRRSLGFKGGGQFYNWLRREGFPSGFQTLCFNCNWAKEHGGCPHQLEKAAV